MPTVKIHHADGRILLPDVPPKCGAKALDGILWCSLIRFVTFRNYTQAIIGWRSRLQELLNTLCTLQGSDGLWYQVVDRPERPDNWTDTSGSAMFLYSMMEARQRIPSHPQQWDTAIAAGLNGLSSRIRPDRKGNLDVLGACDGVCVQMGYRQYVEYPRVPNAKEAVGAVLWAEERAERDSICQRNRESSRPI